MRKQADDGELEFDPHYREMLKVIISLYNTLCLVLTDSDVILVPWCSK